MCRHNGQAECPRPSIRLTRVLFLPESEDYERGVTREQRGPCPATQRVSTTADGDQGHWKHCGTECRDRGAGRGERSGNCGDTKRRSRVVGDRAEDGGDGQLGDPATGSRKDKRKQLRQLWLAQRTSDQRRCRPPKGR